MNCAPQRPASGASAVARGSRATVEALYSPSFSACSWKMDATKQIKFLTYNVWSREDIFVYKRMLAIGALVEKHDPDVIFFQEVTPYIRTIFEHLPWWNKYNCSPVPPEEQPFCLLLSKLPLEKFARWKFANSPTGRCFLEADITPPGAPATTKPIRVATAQLERASPPAPMRCVERYAQAEHAVAALRSADNVVFGGDMCWRDGTDRPFPLPAAAGWLDAWPAWVQALTRPSGGTGVPPSCWTYDSTWEDVGVFGIFKTPHDSMRRRSDRFVGKLMDYSLNGVEMIEDSSTADNMLRYASSRTDYTDYFLRMKPSCHRGLLMTIAPNEPAARPDSPISP